MQPNTSCDHVSRPKPYMVLFHSNADYVYEVYCVAVFIPHVDEMQLIHSSILQVVFGFQ